MRYFTAIAKWERLNYSHTQFVGPCLQTRTNTCPPSPHFWSLFFEKLPPEIHDLIYSFLLGSSRRTATVQGTGTDQHIYHYVPRGKIDRRLNLSSRWPLLQPAPPNSPKPDAREMSGEDRFLYGLSSYFLSTSNCCIRYRYTDHLSSFLTSPFPAFAPGGMPCIPAHHLRRLTILLAPPESPEDDYWYEESWVDWKHVFAEQANERGRLWKENLERDFEKIVVWLREGRECKVTVVVMGVYNEEKNGGKGGGVLGWLEGVKRRAKEDGGDLRVVVN